MSRIISLSVLLAVSALSLPALASNGFTPSKNETDGSYHAMPGGKTRAEVRAELDAARKDGSLARMNSEAGDTRQPASGERTRAEVIEELQRARADGSLRRINTNRGY